LINLIVCFGWLFIDGIWFFKNLNLFLKFKYFILKHLNVKLIFLSFPIPNNIVWYYFPFFYPFTKVGSFRTITHITFFDFFRVIIRWPLKYCCTVILTMKMRFALNLGKNEWKIGIKFNLSDLDRSNLVLIHVSTSNDEIFYYNDAIRAQF